MAIIKRGDGYGVRIWDAAAKRHRWLGTYAKLVDAKRAQADATLKPKAHATVTVEQWARIWLNEYARTAPATQRTYRYAVKQIVSNLGAARLGDIDRPTAKTWANRWPRNTTRVARTMWGDALRDGLCHQNPFTNLRLETPKGRKDMVALTEPEIEGLSRLARDTHGDYGEEMAAIILFAAYIGVRPGELAALKWTDLDPANREATIQPGARRLGRDQAAEERTGSDDRPAATSARGAEHGRAPDRFALRVPRAERQAAHEGLARLPVASGRRCMASEGRTRS